MVQSQRVRELNDKPIDRDAQAVVYWMQQSQRAHFNHALEYAIEIANSLDKPLVVVFGLMDDYPEASERQYAFMLEGLCETHAALRERGIKFVAKHGSPDVVAAHYLKSAAMLICDRGYTRHQKRWRDHVADRAACRVVQVESDVVVPVEAATDKAEYAARTIRPKIRRLCDEYLKSLKPATLTRNSLRTKIDGDIDLSNVETALAKLKIDRSVPRSSRLKGGYHEAKRRLDAFVRSKLKSYDNDRNEPSLEGTSMMSAYLHFGQISPIEIALAGKQSDVYLEELIVRRELAANFVHFTHNYDSYDCLPSWARQTLQSHAKDERPVLYTARQLEAAETHDEYWNAAQREMLVSGFMHNYMRMYWGKKILEWSATPQEAFATTLRLNNKYFIDGRDPNGYANVAWIFGLHDRPWGPQRPIFGLVRYMNAAGLERKFDMKGYVQKVETMT